MPMSAADRTGIHLGDAGRGCSPILLGVAQAGSSYLPYRAATICYFYHVTQPIVLSQGKDTHCSAIFVGHLLAFMPPRA